MNLRSNESILLLPVGIGRVALRRGNSGIKRRQNRRTPLSRSDPKLRRPASRVAGLSRRRSKPAHQLPRAIDLLQISAICFLPSSRIGWIIFGPDTPSPMVVYDKFSSADRSARVSLSALNSSLVKTRASQAAANRQQPHPQCQRGYV